METQALSLMADLVDELAQLVGFTQGPGGDGPGSDGSSSDDDAIGGESGGAAGEAPAGKENGGNEASEAAEGPPLSGGAHAAAEEEEGDDAKASGTPAAALLPAALKGAVAGISTLSVAARSLWAGKGGFGVAGAFGPCRLLQCSSSNFLSLVANSITCEHCDRKARGHW